MERPVLAHPAILWLIQTEFDRANRNGTKMSACCQHVAFAQSQYHVIDSTNLRRAFDDGIKHRLHICRRAADDAEHFRCCRLMLQGLAQFSVALLALLE